MKRQILTPIAVVVLVLFSVLAVQNIRRSNHQLQLKHLEVKSKEVELKELNQRYDEVLKLKAKTQKEKEQQQDKIQELESERKTLQAELQAKRRKALDEQEKLARASKNVLRTQVASAAVGCNTGNQYKDFIYAKESSCDPTAMNASGCYGLGQSCPASKIAHCGADFACQDTWFSNYAVTRYGSWAGAYQFWIANSWW